jgi:hypothetical protein
MAGSVEVHGRCLDLAIAGTPGGHGCLGLAVSASRNRSPCDLTLTDQHEPRSSATGGYRRLQGSAASRLPPVQPPHPLRRRTYAVTPPWVECHWGTPQSCRTRSFLTPVFAIRQFFQPAKYSAKFGSGRVDITADGRTNLVFRLPKPPDMRFHIVVMSQCGEA